MTMMMMVSGHLMIVIVIQSILIVDDLSIIVIWSFEINRLPDKWPGGERISCFALILVLILILIFNFVFWFCQHSPFQSISWLSNDIKLHKIRFRSAATFQNPQIRYFTISTGRMVLQKSGIYTFIEQWIWKQNKDVEKSVIGLAWATLSGIYTFIEPTDEQP